MLECVANVSEGRDDAVIDALAEACGTSLLDVHRDPDHHRSVFTLAGTDDNDAAGAARALAAEVVARVDLTHHDGIHPRLGALDVVPFVALGDTPVTAAVDAAHAFGTWAVTNLGAPIFFYGDADEQRRTLPSTRADAFGARQPDLVPAVVRPDIGAIVVGARPVLVALNCELDRDDRPLAVAIAAAIREDPAQDRRGGLPGVRALGLRLAARSCAQVSMNLVDLERTGIEGACRAVRDHARRAGADVARVELVGLVPAAELARCSEEFLTWSGLGGDQTIEARLAMPLESRIRRWRQ